VHAQPQEAVLVEERLGKTRRGINVTGVPFPAV
jgi:hypothetical protein